VHSQAYPIAASFDGRHGGDYYANTNVIRSHGQQSRNDAYTIITEHLEGTKPVIGVMA